MRAWVGISFGVIVLIGTTVAWCIYPVPPPRATASVADLRHDVSAGPGVQMIDMHLMAQLGDKTVLQVMAKRAVTLGVKQHVIVHEIQAKMQQASGRVWNISAARGLVDPATGDMTAEGGVRLYEKGGYAIETERLALHAAKRILHTDASVLMYGGAVYIVGIGLRHEIDKNRITLPHQVKASFLYDRAQQEAKVSMPLDSFASDFRARAFEHGTTQSEPPADAVPGQ